MYYIKRKIKRNKLIGFGELEGLEIKPTKSKIKVGKVIICDKKLSNKYIKKQLDKKFSKLYKTLYEFLISEDSSEAGVKSCLTEIEKIKSIIFNKYKEYMKTKLYKEYLAKIVLTENEFRDKFMEREYLSRMMKETFENFSSLYDDEKKVGKSR